MDPWVQYLCLSGRGNVAGTGRLGNRVMFRVELGEAMLDPQSENFREDLGMDHYLPKTHVSSHQGTACM